MLISVVIPTVDRREELICAIEGASDQQIDFASLEILVIDNSRNAQQLEVMAPFLCATNTENNIRYVHEARSGLVFARNRGIAESRGDYVIFLDDDQRPTSTLWLDALVKTLINGGTHASFGPVRPMLAETVSAPNAFARDFYARQLKLNNGADVTKQAEYLGTGNSCFDRRACFGENVEIFNERFNNFGGEDIDLLRRLRYQGKRFSWAANAAVFEFVPANRLAKKYLAQRRFQQGQQRSYMNIASEPRRCGALLFWMAVGVLQTIYYFFLTLASYVVGRNEGYEKYSIQIWGGLGKIFWQAMYRRHNYGSASKPV